MNNSRTSFVVFFCLYSFGLADVTNEKAQELYKHLLSKHNKYVNTNIINVTAEIFLEYLLGIEELEDKLTTVLSFQFEWRDDTMSWDNEYYELPIPILTVPDDMVWKPNVELGNPLGTNSALQDYKETKTIYFYLDGRALWTMTRRIDTRCDIDSTYYPFEEQVCQIKIRFPWHTYRLMFRNIQNHLHESEDGNWKISAYEVWREHNDRQYTMDLVFRYHMHRKPLRIVLNVILPVFILVSIAPLVFILPKDAGERIGLIVTILLALSVYMTIVADMLPKTSEPIPIITVVLFAYYISNTCIILLVLINARVCRISDTKVIPYCLQSFVLFTRRCFCQGPLINDAENVCDDSSGANKNDNEARRSLIVNDEECDTIVGQPVDGYKTAGEGKPNHRDKIRWKHVSSAFDKWLFVFIYVLKVIFAVVVTSVLLSGKGKANELDSHDIIIRELLYNSSSQNASDFCCM